MQTNNIRTKDGLSIFITVHKNGTVISVYSNATYTSFNMSNVDARAVAERIINSLDNFELTTTKE